MTNRLAVIIGITTIVFVGIILVWAFSPRNREVSADLTEVTDKGSLQTQTQLSHIGIATGENYFGNRIRVISGVLKNTSDKPLCLVEVRMTFTDFDGKSIQESVQRAYDNRRKPLDPGAQHRFEVNFENLPKTWNYKIPLVEVVKIAY